MSRRTPFSGARLSLAVLISCLAVSQSQAVTITSSPFSLGFGANLNTEDPTPGAWTTTETNSANMPITAGNANATSIVVDTDFTLTPTVVGQTFSGSGPNFTDRELGNHPANSGWGLDFSANLIAAYTGLLPIGATNVQTTLNLTQVSIYAAAFTGGGFSSTSTSFNIHEATTGHTGDSPSTLINAFTDISSLQTFGNYIQTIWNNPADFAQAGTSTTRDFNVLGFGDGTKGYALDGFEIFGNIVVTYELVPEPSSSVLMLVAFSGILCMRRRQ